MTPEEEAAQAAALWADRDRLARAGVSPYGQPPARLTADQRAAAARTDEDSREELGLRAGSRRRRRG
jgi:hypothetical protein